MRIKYIDRKFNKRTAQIIWWANDIIEEYQNKGYDLTLRQLYYQFVARDLIPNKQSEYSKLGNIINNARLAGLIDWETIVDRTRGVKKQAHWNSPAEIMESALYSYAVNKRRSQPIYIEVWVEKDALSDVVGSACLVNDVPYLSCRGYTSQSEMWRAAERIKIYTDEKATIIHLGDHDPSGIDMSRDIEERLNLFIGDMIDINVDRIALNYDQIKEYNPPPNPAKLTDTRFGTYYEKYGNNSWELDALDPTVITKLIHESIAKYTDNEMYEYESGIERKHKKELKDIIKKLKEE